MIGRILHGMRHASIGVASLSVPTQALDSFEGRPTSPSRKPGFWEKKKKWKTKNVQKFRWRINRMPNRFHCEKKIAKITTLGVSFLVGREAFVGQKYIVRKKTTLAVVARTIRFVIFLGHGWDCSFVRVHSFFLVEISKPVLTRVRTVVAPLP